jgi:hypothetical protein
MDVFLSPFETVVYWQRGVRMFVLGGMGFDRCPSSSAVDRFASSMMKEIQFMRVGLLTQSASYMYIYTAKARLHPV